MQSQSVREIPLNTRRTYYAAVALLVAMHTAGAVGLWHPVSRPWFEQLVAFNLIVTAAIASFFHRDFRPAFLLFALVTFLTGYLVEVAGVHTGVIFGQYAYGSALGVKLFDVPLLIGVNWLVLIYCTNVITNRLFSSIWLKIIAGAGLMVLLDFLIEPVAVRYGFWQWENQVIPLQNYVAWFVTSLALSALFHRLTFNKNNPVAPVIFLVQFLFFAALGRL